MIQEYGMRLHETMIAISLLLVAPAAATAQSTDEAAIIATIERLFEALRTADTASFRAAHHPGARIVITDTRPNGEPSAQPIPLDDFVALLAGAADKLDEQIYEPEVRIDGDIATVWTRYDFNVNGSLDHCGFDSFHLARMSSGWKITQGADTQRGKDRCMQGAINLPQPTAADSAAIIAALQAVFDGMEARDSAQLAAAFHPAVAFSPVINGAPQYGDADFFIGMVAGAPAAIHERMYEPELRIHDNLATVWTYYDLHVGEEFSHCGTDAAQLVKTTAGWKVLHISWNRRIEGCR